jgi:hypothetical protein
MSDRNDSPLTYSAVAEKHGVTMTADGIPASENPWARGYGRGASHYRVTLRRPLDMPVPSAAAKTFQCFYSMGSAHTQPPTVAEVLETLTMDFGMFEDTAGKWDYFETFGIEPSEQAEEDYHAAKDQSGRFFDFASGALLRDLLTAAEQS